VYDLPAALDAARNHINLLRQIGDRRGEGLALNRIGITLVNLGQFSEGNKHLLDAYKILHQIGERSGEAISFVYLGIIAEHYKAHDEALAYMKRGLAIQRELDLDTDMAFTLFHIGNVNLARNDLNEAVQAFDEARSLLEANGLPHQISEIYTALSEIDMRREDRVAAKAHVAPLLSRLAQRQLNGLMLPGLAYWRSIQVLERVNDMKQAAQLREVFQAEVNAILDRLVDPRWRDAYINGIWYHAALFKGDHVVSAQG
jgi:tetratricopeptide (TPR) repeat protein